MSTGNKQERQLEKTPRAIRESLFEFFDTLFHDKEFLHSSISVDTSVYYECNNNPDSSCHHDLCRCGIISDYEILYVETYNPMVSKILSLVDMADHPNVGILEYCLDRVLCKSMLVHPHCWELVITNGYYGEEFDGIHMINPSGVVGDITNSIMLLIEQNSPSKWIEYVLRMEYDKILHPKVQDNMMWSIKNVGVEEIRIPNKIRFNQSMNHGGLSRSLNDMRYPVCLVIQGDGGHYTLIDGYRRLSGFLASHRSKKSKLCVSVLVGKSPPVTRE